MELRWKSTINEEGEKSLTRSWKKGEFMNGGVQEKRGGYFHEKSNKGFQEKEKGPLAPYMGGVSLNHR